MAVSRNAPCPCGSGKKYKKCCGSNTAKAGGRPNIPVLLQDALRNLNAGRMDAAEQLLRNVRRHVPTHPDACNILGIICAQTGRTDEALTLLEQAVNQSPQNTQYRYNLGNAQSGAGLFDKAVTSFQALLKQQPGFAEAENNLGMALCGLDRPDEAHGHFLKAIEIRPDYGHAHENLGNVLLQLDQKDAALESLLNARKLQPETAKLLNNLANCYSAKGEEEKAAELYDQALLIEDSGDIQKNRGMHALGCGNYALAIEALMKAKDETPEDALIYYGLADAHENLDDFAAAQTCLQKAASLGFNPAVIELRLGGISKTLGEFKQAARHFETALELDPELTNAFAALAEVTKSDQQSAAMRDKIEQTLDNIELAPKSQIPLYFGLAKQYDDVGEYDAAFEKYRRGNDLRAREDYADYDIGGFRDLVSRLIEFFSADYLQSFADYGSQSRRPIIIFGMPRSGTTLTEQILASHSKVFGAGELDFFHKMGRDLEAGECKDLWPECLTKFGNDRFGELATEYLDFLKSLDADKARISNKMPHNFISVGLIYLLFPNAQFVHCTRQPVDNCLSIYFQNFVGDHPYAYDLQTLGEYYIEYRRLVDHWKTVLPAPILEMSYEKTVGSFEEHARELVKFCNLPWEEACLDFHKTKRAIKTASVWQARQKVYTSSVERWRNYEAHLQPLIDALGPLAGVDA